MRIGDFHTTNYTDTVILPSEDCRATTPRVPGGDGSVAAMQYARLAAAPGALTSDALLIDVLAARQGVEAEGLAALRTAFHAKGQACLRASPLVKTWGWALHHDATSRVTLLDPQGADCAALLDDPGITVVRGMRNRRAS